MIQQAISLHQQGRLNEAAVLYRRLLEQHPRDTALLNLLGAAEIQLRRPDAAIAFLDRAIAIDSNSAAAHCNRGVALQDLKRFQEAVASYDRALAIRSDLHEVLNNRGVVLRELQHLAEALASYDRALTILPAYAEAHGNRGNVLRDLGRPEDALAAYGRALKIRPDYAEARRNRANLLQELERFAEALAELDALLDLMPNDAAAYRAKGVALQKLYRGPEAIETLAKAIALKPDYPEALNNLGNALAETGRLDEAEAQYRRALLLRPLFLEAHLNVAQVLRAKRHFDEAANQYRRAVEIEPQNPWLHVQLGQALVDAGRTDEALTEAETAARVEHKSPVPHFALGVLFARCGEPAEARIHLLHSLEHDPEDSEGARQVLAGLGHGALPERASSAHMKRLYGSRAQYWAGSRGYRGHELVGDVVARAWAGGPAVILDAGCGTGATGPLLRSFASRLEGVDFSGSMLVGARRTQVYDELYEAELVDFLRNQRDCYDVIASAATLIHFGELKSVFSAARRALRANGLFVFTVFPNQNTPEAFGVAPLGGYAEGGCFVHGSDYVRRAATEAGFSILIMETAPHEIDPRGIPVMGLVVALRYDANGSEHKCGTKPT